MFTKEYIENQRQWLKTRHESISKILKTGGDIALLHSPKDIARIDFALWRIKEGQYAICPHCGTFIEKERLSVLPETTFCASCQIESDARNNKLNN